MRTRSPCMLADDEVVELRARDLSRVRAAPCDRKPWALAWAADGRTLLATHLLGPGVTAFGTSPLARRKTWPLADGVAQGLPCRACAAHPSREPHGAVRGIYDALVRPDTSELWVAHLMLGTDTPQPALDFRQTVFPALSIFDARGRPIARLSVRGNPGDGGAFGNVVSGPHALAFSPDGRFAFVADANSGIMLVVDAPGARKQRWSVRRAGTCFRGHRLGRTTISACGAPYRDRRGVPHHRRPGRRRLRRGRRCAFPSLDGRPDASPRCASVRSSISPRTATAVPTTPYLWVACARPVTSRVRTSAVSSGFFEPGPARHAHNAGGLLDTGFLFPPPPIARRSRTTRRRSAPNRGATWRNVRASAALAPRRAGRVRERSHPHADPSVDRRVARRARAARPRRGRARGRGGVRARGLPEMPRWAGEDGFRKRKPRPGSRRAGRIDQDSWRRFAPRRGHVRQDRTDAGRPACRLWRATRGPRARSTRPLCAGCSSGLSTITATTAFWQALADVLPPMLVASTGPGATPEALSRDDTRALVEYPPRPVCATSPRAARRGAPDSGVFGQTVPANWRVTRRRGALS